MKKVVTWPQAKIASAKRSPGTYGSYQELLAKANGLRAEQEAAEKYLMKAMPAMVALLEYKLRHREPLVVMRPLRYQTSEIVKGDEVDQAYYRNSSPRQEKFEDVIKTILPGTELVLKSLDMALQEFVFADAMGNEHSLNFVERNNLMTQTNIFEEVKSFLESKGENHE
jgi:hypothetical protein